MSRIGDMLRIAHLNEKTQSSWVKYIPEIEGYLNDVENTTTGIAPLELYKGLPVHDLIAEALKLPSSAVDRGNLILLAATRTKT